MSRGPSPHLAWSELACRDPGRTPYPVEWRAVRAGPLAREFERIRSLVGQPIRIGSAYRTAAWNTHVGGARRSQHVQGRALDLYPPPGWTLDRFYYAIRAYAVSEASHIRGLARYPAFVHIDTRQFSGKRLACWDGHRVQAELRT